MPNDLYNDLPLTNFPSSLDNFTTWLNVTATDGPLIQQYITAMNAGNQTLANQILAQISSASQKIITATDLNTMTQAIQAVERFYLTDIEPYIETQQESWLNTINQFSYQGTWQVGTNYITNNIVSYTVSGVNLLFIATSNPPTGTVPTNTTYWRVLTIQGQQGASGTGLSYRQEWSASHSYQTNDAVTYNAAIWMATQPSQNQIPSEGSAYWNLVMTLEATTYPIQPTEPTNLEVNGLWFNTQDNPTQYYYLEALTNPATTSQIVYGYEAYDEQGNLLTGSLPVPTSLAVTTNPNQMTYLVGQSFDPTGMVVTATYSDGSQKVVTGYTYSPTGALTAQDTTISISYTDTGTTVGTTLGITVNAINTTLNNNSWDVISYVSAQSQGANYWAVGDSKQVIINGTIGTIDFSSYSSWVYIIGFNHNEALEGQGITFGTFKTSQSSGIDICLIDSNYTVSNNNGLKILNINHWGNTSNHNMNYGGWAGCCLRYDILGSTDQAPSGYGATPTTSNVGYNASSTTATSPVNNTLMAAFPNDLRSVMKPMTIYTDNTGNSSNVQANVTASIDYLPLLAEFEVFGVRTNANQYEQIYQEQYAYYSAGNSKVKYRYSATSSTAYWWERSPYYNSYYDFCCVNGVGSTNSFNDAYSLGIAPIFRV